MYTIPHNYTTLLLTFFSCEASYTEFGKKTIQCLFLSRLWWFFSFGQVGSVKQYDLWSWPPAKNGRYMTWFPKAYSPQFVTLLHPEDPAGSHPKNWGGWIFVIFVILRLGDDLCRCQPLVLGGDGKHVRQYSIFRSLKAGWHLFWGFLGPTRR